MSEKQNVTSISNEEFNTLCKKYIAGKKHVDECNEKLKEIREKLMDFCCLREDTEKTEYLESATHSVKVEHKVTRKIDQKVIPNLVFPSNFSVDSCFSKKYEFSKTLWKNLPQNVKDIAEQAITTTPASAGFSIEEIKEN